jgi:zinc D-Ala-D-Ala dipeptidase
MLWEANKRLPAGYRLAIIEGWRPPHIQRRMYLTVWQQFQERHPDWSDVKLKRVVNRFTAPMNLRVPPPHTTGGAVDVALVLTDGTPCDAHSPYDWDDPASFPFDAPGLSDEARRTRAMLADALIPTGLTNYPSEYWHWSYGDQGWAYRGGHPYALYAAITPPNWTPDPADEGESPLEWVGQYAADNAA